MGNLNDILRQLDHRCLRDECHEGDCCLSLQGLEQIQYIIVGMDGPGAPVSKTETRCDFLFLDAQKVAKSSGSVP